MEDFGEALVDIRDRVADPLPVRVRRWRVFITAFLEAFAVMPLRLLNRRFMPSVLVHPNLRPIPIADDLAKLMVEFARLRDRECTQDQFDQARTVLDTALAKQQARRAYEQALWNNAVDAGMFLGTLSSTLIMVSASLSMITDHPAAGVAFMMAFLLTQGIAATVCLNGWHTR